MKPNTVILATLLLISCGDLARFEEPQPEGKSDEKGIPRRLLGQYLSLNDSSKLTIADQFIVKYSTVEFSGKLDSIDRKEIGGDTVYSGTDNSMKLDVTVEGDSTFQRWIYRDTLFNFSSGDILRKYKGHYFLNHEVSTNSWRVTTLTRIENGVTLGTISPTDDINNLRELTEVKSDSVFSFRPTRKELKRFLKRKGFSERDTFLKIR